MTTAAGVAATLTVTQLITESGLRRDIVCEMERASIVS